MARRLVSWEYVDGDGGLFEEVVDVTPEQEEALRTFLESLAKCPSEESPSWISDVYVGPEQEVATTFADFRDSLIDNPIIEAAAEEYEELHGQKLELI